MDTLPEFYREEMTALYGDEMEKRETLEAKIYKAIDNLEAVIQHNISDLATWIPKEYELNKTYGDDKGGLLRISQGPAGGSPQGHREGSWGSDDR